MNTEFKVEYMKIKLGIAIFFILTLFTGTVSASSGCTIDSNMGENLDTKVCDAQNYTIMIEGKSLDNQNIMQQRSMFIDKFLNEMSDKKEPRHIGKVKNLKSPKNTELVAYGFKILSNGVVKEYRGYCNNVSKGYEKALSRADMWYKNVSIKPSNLDINEDGTDITTSSFETTSNDWELIGSYTNEYTYSPHGDYETRTRWYWDDEETNSDKDYFMLRSRVTLMPGNQQYSSDWLNNYAYINHDWAYYDYPGTRDLGNAKPFDESGESEISITLSGWSVSGTWTTTIPDYSIDDKSDYIDEIAKWEADINPLSSSCGGSSLSMEPGSTMEWSQSDARSGEWVDLARFEAKPEWIDIDPYDTFTPGFLGHACCVKWTGSDYTDG